MMISTNKLNEILDKYEVDKLVSYKIRQVHMDSLSNRFHNDYFYGFVNGLRFAGVLGPEVVNDIAVSMVLGE